MELQAFPDSDSKMSKDLVNYSALGTCASLMRLLHAQICLPCSKCSCSGCACREAAIMELQAFPDSESKVSQDLVKSITLGIER